MNLKEIRKFSDEQWTALFEQEGGWTIASILNQLGAYGAMAHRDVVESAAIRLGYDRRKHRKMSYTRQQVEDAASKSICWSDMLRELGLKPHGNNQQTVKRCVEEYNIELNFDLTKARSRKNKILNEALLRKTDVFIHRSQIRSLILRKNLLPFKCALCDIGAEWCGKPLNMQLDHIDGDTYNNELNNLRFLCPNCHSQTETFGRKNKKHSQ